MAATTLVTFLLQTSRSVRSVQLLGSWDNFARPYPMSRDDRMGHGHWRGCHSFLNIICDGDRVQPHDARDGGLKMGGRYWYYYQLDDDCEYHNPREPSTTFCPFLPGQIVNVLDVPVQVKDRRRVGHRPSKSSIASHTFTLDPKDKYRTPRPPATPPLSSKLSPYTRSSASLANPETRSTSGRKQAAVDDLWSSHFDPFASPSSTSSASLLRLVCSEPVPRQMHIQEYVDRLRPTRSSGDCRLSTLEILYDAILYPHLDIDASDEACHSAWHDGFDDPESESASSMLPTHTRDSPRMGSAGDDALSAWPITHLQSATESAWQRLELRLDHDLDMDIFMPVEQLSLAEDQVLHSDRSLPSSQSVLDSQPDLSLQLDQLPLDEAHLSLHSTHLPEDQQDLSLHSWLDLDEEEAGYAAEHDETSFLHHSRPSDDDYHHYFASSVAVSEPDNLPPSLRRNSSMRHAKSAASSSNRTSALFPASSLGTTADDYTSPHSQSQPETPMSTDFDGPTFFLDHTYLPSSDGLDGLSLGSILLLNDDTADNSFDQLRTGPKDDKSKQAGIGYSVAEHASQLTLRNLPVQTPEPESKRGLVEQWSLQVDEAATATAAAAAAAFQKSEAAEHSVLPSNINAERSTMQEMFDELAYLGGMIV